MVSVINLDRFYHKIVMDEPLKKTPNKPAQSANVEANDKMSVSTQIIITVRFMQRATVCMGNVKPDQILIKHKI